MPHNPFYYICVQPSQYAAARAAGFTIKESSLLSLAVGGRGTTEQWADLDLTTSRPSCLTEAAAPNFPVLTNAGAEKFVGKSEFQIHEVF